MYKIDNFILNIAMVITSIWIVKRFWGGFFEKKENKIVNCALYTFYGLFQFIVQYSRGTIDIGITVINFLLVFIIAMLGYKNEGKKKIFLLVIFYAVWSLVEVFIYILIRAVPIERPYVDIMGLVISNILMILFVCILPMVWNEKENDHIPIKHYIFLLLIPAGSIYVAINEFYSKDNTILSLITISIMLLFNVIIFEIHLKLSETFRYEKEKTVYIQQLDMVTKNIKAQKKMIEDFYVEKHNLINELAALKNSVENDERITVIRNLKRIIKNCNFSEIVSNSGNSTIDSLINFKYADAKQYGINFRIKVFIPEELPIEQCDMGVVLGNSLDNAIEATKECVKNEKIIEITMGVKKEALVIVIKNPYEHILREDRNGNYLSTKKERYQHGYGLKSIKKIVEEYQGSVMITADKNYFSLIIVMNFKDF